jgi:hypothetical protein
MCFLEIKLSAVIFCYGTFKLECQQMRSHGKNKRNTCLPHISGGISAAEENICG